MEGSLISEHKTKSRDDPKQADTPAAKKGKSLHKTIVTVKIEAAAASGGGKQKNEGPPGDSWSWRKYGQKPIKGSPYPRGYYRCSTYKGCSAKKQVERCRTDASMLLVTYTSTHNHPGPPFEQLQQEPPPQSTTDQVRVEPNTEEHQDMEDPRQQSSMNDNEEDATTREHFHYIESADQDVTNHNTHPFSVELDNGAHESLGSVLFDEEPVTPYPPPVATFSKLAVESDEYDFFDELEELPMSSSFTSFTQSSFVYDDRILIQPS